MMTIKKLICNLLQPKGYTKGILCYKKMEWGKAIVNFNNAISSNKNHSKSYFKRGVCYLKINEYKQAYDNISKAIELAPDRKEWRQQLEQCRRHMNMLSSANVSDEVSLKEKIKLDYCNHKLHEQLAVVLNKKRRYWQEIEELKIAISQNSSNVEMLFRLGSALEKMKRFKEAGKYYQLGLSKKSKSEAIWYYSLGYVLEKEGHDGNPDLEAAKAAYKLAISRDKSLKGNEFGIGVFHQHKGRWGDAVKAYLEYINEKPLCAELYYRIALSYDRCYQWSDAETYYRKALALNINIAHWHYRLGFVLERQLKYAQAAISYQFAAQHSKKEIPYWYYRSAYSYACAGDFEKSCFMYIKGYDPQVLITEDNKLQYDVDDPFLMSYRDELNHHCKIDTLINILENDCVDRDAWFAIGAAYEEINNWCLAAYSYHHAVMRSNSHEKECYLKLGISYLNQNNYEKASEVFSNLEMFGNAYGVPDDIIIKDKKFKENASYVNYYEGLKVEDKSILYESFHGSTISCNPYALFLSIYHDERFSDYKHIWVINDKSKIPKALRGASNVVFVARQSDSYRRYLATCAILINNVSFPEYFIRKKQQKYLNTWHGTPIKYLGKDIKDEFLAHKNVARNFLQTTHLLSPNNYTTDILLSRYDVSNLYSGKVGVLGYPRMDLTVNITNERIHQIRNILHVAQEDKLVLYAPTWRGVHGKATLDVDKLKNDLMLLSAQECSLVFRGHHMIEKIIKELDIPDVRIVPSGIDTNELLGAVDILITDYSSIAFDFLVCNKPIIYYAYDLLEYMEERGLYFPLTELPGKVIQNGNELIESLNDYLFDQKKFDASLAINKYCPHDNGQVSERVKDWFIFGDDKYTTPQDKKENILFYIGPFLPNGILSSWLNLMDKINKEKYKIILVVEPQSIYKFDERLEQFKKISSEIQIIGTCGDMLYSVEEKWLNDKLNSHFTLSSAEMFNILNGAYAREFVRLFGRNYIDNIIHFEGYNQPWVLRFANAPKEFVGNKVIYQHNDMLSEWKDKFPYLEVVFRYYNRFEKIVSVSEETMALNKVNLCERFNIDPSKMIFCDNVQNQENVIEKASVQEDMTFNFSDDIVYFISVGRLSIEKDHMKLINAFNRIHAEISKTELLILGEGPLENELIRHVSELGINNSVHLLGRLSNPFPLMKRSDCFILSSNHEGQPMVLFEAIILNKPIIATDIIGARSVLNNRTGVLVDNSEDGLYSGMRDFIENKLTFNDYDIEDYQNNAIEMFYQKCLH